MVIEKFVASLFPLLLLWSAYAYRRYSIPCACSWFAAIVMMLLLLDTTTFPVLIAMIVAFVASNRNDVSSAKFLAVSLLVTACVLSLCQLPDVVYRAQLRREYPMESLASRIPRPASNVPDGNVMLSESAKHHLDQLEGGVWGPEDERGFELRHAFARGRRERLERLHRGVVDDFLNAPGFGMVRAPTLRGGIPTIPPRPSVPQSPPQVDPATADPGANADPQMPAKEFPKRHFAQEHLEAVRDFAQPQDFGYVRSIEEAAGFEPHAFAEPIKEDNQWNVTRVELVSLLNHDPPIAYVTQNLPRMDEIKEAPTRPLNSFEQRAIADLRQGEEVVVEQRGNRARMVGSIRATSKCVECHSVPRGFLLGAFTYDIRNDGRPVAEPAVKEDPRI